MKSLLLILSGLIFCSAAFPRLDSPSNVTRRNMAELNTSQDDELAKSIQRGKMVYSENCISCHMGTGEGVTATFPPLAKSDYLFPDHTNAIKAIKFGLYGKIKVNGVDYDNMMPNPGIENDEIADVLNYILNSWGNSSDKKIVTEKMVADVKQK